MDMEKIRHKIFIIHLHARIKIRSKKNIRYSMFSQCTAESRQFAKEETSAGEHVQRRKTLLSSG